MFLERARPVGLSAEKSAWLPGASRTNRCRWFGDWGIGKDYAWLNLGNSAGRELVRIGDRQGVLLGVVRDCLRVDRMRGGRKDQNAYEGLEEVQN